VLACQLPLNSWGNIPNEMDLFHMIPVPNGQLGRHIAADGNTVDAPALAVAPCCLAIDARTDTLLVVKISTRSAGPVEVEQNGKLDAAGSSEFSDPGSG
jgi:hypothetical protein